MSLLGTVLIFATTCITWRRRHRLPQSIACCRRRPLRWATWPVGVPAYQLVLRLGLPLAAPFLVFGFAVYAGSACWQADAAMEIFLRAVPLNIMCGAYHVGADGSLMTGCF